MAEVAHKNPRDPVSWLGWLGLLLIGFKLTHKLDDWSWPEVLAPLWAPGAILLSIAAGGLVVAFITWAIAAIAHKMR